MSTPARIEDEHYQKFAGCQILAIYWDEIEGKALPILVLSGSDLDGHAATAAVLADPEGMHAIAYNVIRALILRAAVMHQQHLGRICFKGAVDLLRQWLPQAAACHDRPR